MELQGSVPGKREPDTTLLDEISAVTGG